MLRLSSLHRIPINMFNADGEHLDTLFNLNNIQVLLYVQSAVERCGILKTLLK